MYISAGTLADAFELGDLMLGVESYEDCQVRRVFFTSAMEWTRDLRFVLAERLCAERPSWPVSEH